MAREHPSGRIVRYLCDEGHSKQACVPEGCVLVQRREIRGAAHARSVGDVQSADASIRHGTSRCGWLAKRNDSQVSTEAGGCDRLRRDLYACGTGAAEYNLSSRCM